MEEWRSGRVKGEEYCGMGVKKQSADTKTEGHLRSFNYLSAFCQVAQEHPAA